MLPALHDGTLGFVMTIIPACSLEFVLFQLLTQSRITSPITACAHLRMVCRAPDSAEAGNSSFLISMYVLYICQFFYLKTTTTTLVWL